MLKYIELYLDYKILNCIILADLHNYILFNYNKFIIEIKKPNSLINLLCLADI
jgi:hypothetical protein